MFLFQNLFVILGLLCIFANFTYGESDLSNIREKGSTNNNAAANVGNTHISAFNNTQNPVLESHTKQHGSPSLLQVPSEGGIVSSVIDSHSGRENVLENPAKTEKTNISANTLPLPKSNDIKPVQESVMSSLDIAPQHDDEKPSVPKKGVSFADLEPQLRNNFANVTDKVMLNVSNTASLKDNTILKKVNTVKSNFSSVNNNNSSKNITVNHKKPLVTESDSEFIELSKTKEDTSKENTITVDQIDPMLVDSKTNRSDYIVPIVAVILSVPLVAILASIFYKRGTDWWQHRKYKRMDFLIEGMYHN